jgi:hypothetical protein
VYSGKRSPNEGSGSTFRTASTLSSKGIMCQFWLTDNLGRESRTQWARQARGNKVIPQPWVSEQRWTILPAPQLRDFDTPAGTVLNVFGRYHSPCRSASFRKPSGLTSESLTPELWVENAYEIFCCIHDRITAKWCFSTSGKNWQRQTMANDGHLRRGMSRESVMKLPVDKM